jgi:precorrin-6B methylase 2
VDTFQGSDDEQDATNSIAKQENIYEQFMANVGHFENLRVLKMTSAEAAEQLKDEKFDLIFID